MTQRDYIRLAAALRYALEEARGSIGETTGVRKAIMVIEDTLAEERPQFNRAKFLKAVYGA